MSFPEDEILVTLMRGPKSGMSIKEIAEATGRSYSTVRQHLNVIGRQYRYGVRPEVDWVEAVPGSRSVSEHKPSRYRLNAKGREVARNRARRM